MKKKTQLNRALTKIFGNPVSMSAKCKKEALILFSRWYKQSKGKPYAKDYSYFLPSKHSADVAKEYTFVKHAARSETSFRWPNMRWRITPVVRRPSSKALSNLIGPEVLLHPLPDASIGWMEKEYGKKIRIVIPVTYYKNVPPELRCIGRKVVQKVQNHRVYSESEVWECHYYDFTDLTNDENSYSKAKWLHGYIVKMDIVTVLEPSLEKALSKARSMTIRRVIKSVEDDNED